MRLRWTFALCTLLMLAASSASAGEKEVYYFASSTDVYEGQPVVISVAVMPSEIRELERETEIWATKTLRGAPRIGKGAVQDAVNRKRYDVSVKRLTASNALPKEYGIDVHLVQGKRRFKPVFFADLRAVKSRYADINYSTTQLAVSTIGIPPGRYQVEVKVRQKDKEQLALNGLRASAPVNIQPVRTDEDRVKLLAKMSSYYLEAGNLEKAEEFLRTATSGFPDLSSSSRVDLLRRRRAIFQEQKNASGEFAATLAAVSHPEMRKGYDISRFANLAKRMDLDNTLQAISTASELSREYFAKDVVDAKKAEAFVRALHKAAGKESGDPKYHKALTKVPPPF